ncbi:MAG TPA: amidophosphoribosyltransferase [Polyangiaceae bacterium LLY-WYZ-15_(1-7)]|nr:amidophosphoribosyltransferase [Sandaracinus sp.]HJK91727.1 amidophosphoribosyltransferase [Polyangiaceae bacterium LLY-WYZ-15_(1-7)]MBJ73894.1 amidophosphoribosyltransferase [Sandaracinus sp.]HJL03563.1 amidophosphoribosyltransferase [Polyangiaceae bacterium LLY-WYZ-15_(1-7)]HJL09395.1 amidophosphoribosyltransferase [Polyangiaceae bacterium LLY-WYZ-15_(1-7)]
MASPDDLLDDHFHDECGVFGVFGAAEAANFTYLGLHSLQHRGQEACGIVSSNGEQLFVHRGLGLVQDVFSAAVLDRLPGNRAIGHVRYSTAGGSHIKNAQPIAVDCGHGSIAVAHNGNLTNGEALRRKLEAEGSIFSSSSDTEVLVHLIARSREEQMVDRVADALRQVAGAYSLVFLSPEELVAVRDPFGFRPLCLGQVGDAFMVASEPPAFGLIGGEYVRDIEPGEMIVMNQFGMRSLFPFEERPRRMCIFEHVYFARPDASFDDIGVYRARQRMGEMLARENPVDADLVLPVPDSGVAAALGFSREAGLPYEMGLIRSHYVGRTFIEPSQSIRHFGVRLKLHPVAELLRGKRVAVVDDSIVRGTTSRKIVKMIRDAGAAEVHLRISSPPTRWPCFYGIDTPTRDELIAARHTPEDIARYVTADSLGYLSIEGLRSAVGGDGYCDACFSGEYPVPVELDRESGRRQLPLVGV